jgi:RNA polymerase sigma-70 factor (ECF subfamily)
VPFETAPSIDIMNQQELIPHLFRREYQKIVSVLCYKFGIDHIETAEDIVSDTFLAATETWSINGIPDNPSAWLYTVSKNKTKNHIKRNSVFEQKIACEIRSTAPRTEETEINLSPENIADSQLAMMFTVCSPVIPAESQIALALNLLCGFSIQEIASAFLTNREVIYKRISRGKERLKETGIKIEQPDASQIKDRLDAVLTTLYLLFSEGYYSASQETVLRKDFCLEAMRLCHMLTENDNTNRPEVKALLALMHFHASRFEARIKEDGEIILYEEQDTSLWDWALIEKGIAFLNQASTGSIISKYHLEAGIAYWHTVKTDSKEKWETILYFYNELLIREYSPMAALNRAFAISKLKGKEAAITEAEKLKLISNHFYNYLLGDLYTGIEDKKALEYYLAALNLATSTADKAIIAGRIQKLKMAISSPPPSATS